MNEPNKEYTYKGKIINGFVMLAILFVLVPAVIICGFSLLPDYERGLIALTLIVGICAVICLVGFFVQEPNQSRVMIFFGKYCGSFDKVGFFWMNPFYSRKKISLRIRNMDIEPIKVNDKVGNPVLIGMVLVWKVSDTYRVVFDLDTPDAAGASAVSRTALQNFVRIQSDAALREVTSEFAYDPESGHPEELTLRNGGEKINDILERKLNERLAMAGVEVVEARINYLAYAPEIAAVMLRRQQASAIISAREKIVEGAVSMVEMALSRIESKGIVELNNAEKASMVGNLLVVLCADEPATPMLNTTQS